jgi:hypothetical protein
MNIWTGLLFLEGAVADATLARELAEDQASPLDLSNAHPDKPGVAHDAVVADRSFTGSGDH